MIFDVTELKEFYEIVEPVMEYLSKYHPHVKIIIESGRAEFVECVTAHVTDKYIQD